MNAETEFSSFDEICQEYQEFNRIINTITQISTMARTITALMLFYSPQRSADTEFMDYQHPEQKVERPSHNDRVFPLETVRLQDFAAKTGIKPDTAVIHTGPFADEFARSFNALAVTIANDIYFRGASYNPASEEGRIILTHELTHAGQFSEKRITKNITEKELEEEAELAEKHETFNPDPYVIVDINGKDFKMLKSQMKEYAYYIADDIEKWVESRKHYLEEKEYLAFLCSLREWLTEVN